MGAFSRVGIVGTLVSLSDLQLFQQLIQVLRRQNLAFVLEESLQAYTSNDADIQDFSHFVSQIDLLVIVGGDQAFRESITQSHSPLPPILAIGGHRGFLSDLLPGRAKPLLQAILQGEYTEEQRYLLQLRLLNKGRKPKKIRAINEMILRAAYAEKGMLFNLSIDGQFVYRQQAEGFVVSTPTGSTSYSLSVGGPLVHPHLEVLLLMPLAPARQSRRPMVVNGRSKIQLQLLPMGESAVKLYGDGRRQLTAQPGELVELTSSNEHIQMLHPVGYDYFSLCRQKLGWEPGRPPVMCQQEAWPAFLEARG